MSIRSLTLLSASFSTLRGRHLPGEPLACATLHRQREVIRAKATVIRVVKQLKGDSKTLSSAMKSINLAC